MMKGFLIACLGILGALAWPQAPAKAYVVANSWPVVLIHGFTSASSDDCPQEFGNLPQYLPLHAFTGPVISIGYYASDTNCTTSIVNWSATHDTTDHCALDYEIPGADGTNGEDLRHVACELDWYLWDNWWVHGWNVDIVAHSMGGLIAQWGLAAHGGSLPTNRYTQDVVTAGTPYEGLAQLLPCGCLQAQQIQTGSDFLAALSTNGNPQATAGTNWTMLGSGCDGSTSIGMDGGTKVVYHAPCYTHGGYFGDTTATDNASVDYSVNQSADVVNQSSSTWEHSLHYITRVLEGMEQP